MKSEVLLLPEEHEINKKMEICCQIRKSLDKVGILVPQLNIPDDIWVNLKEE